MAQAHLQIDLGALKANWRALDAMTSVETAATVKANGYGLGAGRAGMLWQKRARGGFSWRWPKKGPPCARQIGPEPANPCLWRALWRMTQPRLREPRG